jgi:hypothetical protein
VARHAVYAEPDGCVVHGVSVAGFETRYRRWCTWNELNLTRRVGECFFDPARAGEGASVCDAEIEPVLVGIIPPPIAHLCLGTFDGPPTRIVDAVVIAPEQNVPFIELLPPGEAVVPIPFTADGRFYGEPEIDTDVDLMIRVCSDAGPWDGPSGEEHLLAHISGPAQIDETTVFLDFGLGPRGFVVPEAFNHGPFEYRLDPAAASFRAAIGEGIGLDWVELPIPPDLDPADAVIVIPGSLDPREIRLING